MSTGKPIILCDFDGTITTMDVADTIFTVYLSDRWDEIDQEWHRGDISMTELYEKCWDLVAVGEKELIDFVNRIDIDESFAGFIRIVEKNGIMVSIVSDGFDFYIERIMKKYGFEYLPHYSNDLYFDDSGKMALRFGNQNLECVQCANCKKFVMDEKRKEADFVIYIGNGLSDRCAAEHADLVFAKDSLLNHCEKAGIDYVSYKSFDDIINYLNEKGIIELES
jgi:2,3-diketo-5-methylthio-1-phosphopentane phosphatase